MTTNLADPMMRARTDIGETLIEIVLTVVIIGLTVTALLSSLATAGNAGNVQRISVQADVVMRNYAEATKAAVEGCVAGGSYSVTYPATEAPLPPGFTLPTGAGGLCPAVNTTQALTLLVAGPLGFRDSMDIKVRTP
jgi:type II secretory pathway pseudopilin PulG